MLDQETLAVLRENFKKIKVAEKHHKVYKDECVVSFDSPFTATGLYVNLSTLYGFGEAYYLADSERTGSALYLHEQWEQVPVEQTAPTGSNNAPTELAIGVAGGFMTESKWDIVKTHTLVVVMDRASGTVKRIPLPSQEIPEFVSTVIQSIIDHDGMKSKMQLDTWSADQEIFESKYARDLPQLDNGKKISQDPKTWACEQSGQTENLWLNLSTGYIGGGRKNWDGTGGSGAALQHYLDTGSRYPLCVKLGTITPHGGDVWSYSAEEDTLVKDPLLAQHLAHWGINIMSLEKTDKTMGEMEVDLNMKYDWSKILESGEQLQALSGPGLVGLRNIGSSCYLNAVVQVLASIPEVAQRYLGNRPALLSAAAQPSDAPTDFAVQMSKLVDALLTDRYCPPSSSSTSNTVTMTTNEESPDLSSLERFVVAPRMFKMLVGKDHPEFSSGRQQDAAEYFLHLVEFMKRAERQALARMPDLPPSASGLSSSGLLPTVPTSALFDHSLLVRDECNATNMVRYSTTPSVALGLTIPLDQATPVSDPAALLPTSPEGNDKKKQRVLEEGGADEEGKMDTDNSPSSSSSSSGAGAGAGGEPAGKVTVSFEACLAASLGTEAIEGFSNPALAGEKTTATRTTLFASFPPYLMIQINRYVQGPNWVPLKIDALIPVPEELDLEHLRGSGLQQGEVAMPDAPASSASSSGSGSASASGSGAVVPNPMVVEAVTNMGFSEFAGQRAALATGNADPEAAVNWTLAHIEDVDLNDPLPLPPLLNGPAGAGAGAGAGGGEEFSAAVVEQLTSMGFTAEQARAALGSTSGDVARACDWLFSRDDLDLAVAEYLSGPAPASASASPSGSSTSTGAGAGAGAGASSVLDGPGRYSLVAIISHIGKSTSAGHYVAHIKKDGAWVLFNDDKVAASKQPPLDAGYMYLFKRHE